MMIRKLVIAAISLAAIIPGVAQADSKARQARDQKENRVIMFDYAKCVVKERHSRAAEAILKNLTNDEILKNYNDLIRGDCLVAAAHGPADMKFRGDLYRYALADALVNADLAKTVENDFSNRAPLVHVEPISQAQIDAMIASTKGTRKRTQLQDGFAKQASVSWLSHYGECVVRHDPANTKGWLLSAPNSPDEGLRVSALKQAFGDCLVSDKPVAFNRLTMRGLVAINYYRLAMAKAAPAVEGTH